jgi:RNA polymerase sigma factor (TIGR02999 family)
MSSGSSGSTGPTGPTGVADAADAAIALEADLAHALGDLRQIAAAALARERPGHTLQPTALVNEFWLRLASSHGYEGLRFPTRDHLLAYASEAIGNILVDHARRRDARKRGGGRRPVPLEAHEPVAHPGGSLTHERAMDVAELLARLELEHPLSARVARMRYFGQMSASSIAGVLDVSPRSVSNYWRAARAWLACELGERRPR